MTREDVLEMEAGPEMDRAVADAFPDLPKHYFSDEDGVRRERLMPRSTDIAAAWEVVEHFGQTDVEQNEGWMWSINSGHGTDDTGEWCARAGHSRCAGWYVAVAPAAPLAICRAALLTTLEDTGA